MKLSVKFLLVLQLLVLALAGCGKKTESGAGVGKYGMLGESTPEYAAVKFFDHIYHDDNISNALRYSSPRMARILTSYRTNRNVQRHVLNLVYDSVIMELDSGGVGMNEFAQETQITVFFDGQYQGDDTKDLRTAELIRTKNGWKVDRIKAEMQ